MTIEQRLTKLERQNRWMKRGGGLALAAVACVVLIGQGKPKELPDLEARSLTIRDRSGKARITLGFDRQGSRAQIKLMNQNQNALVLLEAEQGEPGIRAAYGVMVRRASLSIGYGDNRATIRASRSGGAVRLTGHNFGEAGLTASSEGRLHLSARLHGWAVNALGRKRDVV